MQPDYAQTKSIIKNDALCYFKLYIQFCQHYWLKYVKYKNAQKVQLRFNIHTQRIFIINHS